MRAGPARTSGIASEPAVSLEDGSATVTPDRSDGYRLDVDDAKLNIEDPSVGQRFAVATPPVLAALVIGGMIASVAASLSSIQLAGEADTALPIESTAPLSFLPIPVGLVLAVLAEVFRRGAILRDDVSGLV
ncbi:hypothetical protein BH20ACT4_BH20ACT4_10650 [soil metagenome]